jgi:hypothetical protein
VREQLGPRERVVERRDDHDRGGAGLFGVHAQLDGLARRERARPGDDGDAAGGRFDGDFDEVTALGVRERGELAGAPADHDQVDRSRGPARRPGGSLAATFGSPPRHAVKSTTPTRDAMSRSERFR